MDFVFFCRFPHCNFNLFQVIDFKGKGCCEWCREEFPSVIVFFSADGEAFGWKRACVILHSQINSYRSASSSAHVTRLVLREALSIDICFQSLRQISSQKYLKTKYIKSSFDLSYLIFVFFPYVVLILNNFIYTFYFELQVPFIFDHFNEYEETISLILMFLDSVWI